MGYSALCTGQVAAFDSCCSLRGNDQAAFYAEQHYFLRFLLSACIHFTPKVSQFRPGSALFVEMQQLSCHEKKVSEESKHLPVRSCDVIKKRFFFWSSALHENRSREQYAVQGPAEMNWAGVRLRCIPFLKSLVWKKEEHKGKELILWNPSCASNRIIQFQLVWANCFPEKVWLTLLKNPGGEEIGYGSKILPLTSRLQQFQPSQKREQGTCSLKVRSSLKISPRFALWLPSSLQSAMTANSIVDALL